MNKPRRPCIAALLSFFTIGLGHIYAGEAKKGILLYFGQGLFLLLLPILFIKPNIFILLFILIASSAYFIFCLINAVRTARKNSDSYPLQKFNKWYIYLACFIFANLVVQPFVGTIIRENLIKAYKIPAGSMVPTLLVGDHIIVDRLVYKKNQPKRGDVVVFEYPRDPSLDYIKRVVAVGGDLVEMKDKKIFINGELQKEDFVTHRDKNVLPASQGPRDTFGPVAVPENSVFVMGDNRDNSFDSRFWGFVHEDKIRGKAMSIYWSWDVKKPLISSSRWSSIRWDRIGKEIE